MQLGVDLLDATIARLAVESKVSQPTVVRFCNRLGFSGIKAMKRALVAAPAPSNRARSEARLQQLDSVDDIVSFVFSHMLEVLTEAERTIDRRQLEQAIHLLDSASFVRIAGVGGSSIIARHVQHYLRRIGIHCAPLSIYESADIGIEQYKRGDVVLAISYSGDNHLIVQTVSDAKAKGAPVICLTTWGENRLQALADVTIQVPYGGQGVIHGHHAVERTAQIAAANILFTALYLKRVQVQETPGPQPTALL